MTTTAVFRNQAGELECSVCDGTETTGHEWDCPIAMGQGATY